MVNSHPSMEIFKIFDESLSEEKHSQNTISAKLIWTK
jgi:hypothetical protein